MEADPVTTQVNPQPPLPSANRRHVSTSLRRPVRVLSPETTARIAAGEVIDRPASVVKELVENAVDAGATEVRIDVRGGGLGMIRVSDDGVGIRKRDIWLACQRHATSKLSEDDLQKVDTLGFRGEALPSIATVAELSIVSAIDESGVGHRLTLRNGRTVDDEPAPRPRGTTVTVRRLFEWVPARLEAASSARAELTQITTTIRRLALAASSVKLTLYIDDRLSIQTTGSGDLSTVMIELFGPAISKSLIVLGPTQESGANVFGVMSGPELTRPGRGQVNLIVNRRWVQPRSILSMIEAAYRPVLPRGRHPMLTLCIELPPELVDINIHPSKLDVRLRNDRAIGHVLAKLIRDALGNRPIPLREPLAFGRAALDPIQQIHEEREVWDDERPIVTPSLPPLKLIGQMQRRLLMLEGSEGLYLVDQHRAHERIIYERLMANRTAIQPEHRALPEPLLIELRPAQVARFARRMPDLEALGFQCEEFGGRTFLLRQAPVLPGVLQSLDGQSLGDAASAGEPEDLIATLVSLAVDDDETSETWQDRLLVSLACRTAIRRGRELDRPTMRSLIDALGHTSSPAICPHGSPLLVHLSGSVLERQFDWR